MPVRVDRIQVLWNAELDVALPLRELSPCHVVANDDVDFGAAQHFPLHQGLTAVFQLLARG